MKNKILDYIMNIIKKYNNVDNVKLEEIRYGLESLYLSIFKFLVVIIISFFIHIYKELCLIFLIYGPLRLTGFGLHTKNSLECWIFSITIFTLIPYLVKKIYINEYFLLFLSIILLILMIFYSPSDTEKRPLINKKKRTIYKIISSVISLIYVITIYFTKSIYIKKLFTFSILIEVLLILPISYKLLGLKYNNYLNYRKGG